jgi:hypothetical protein
MVSPWVAPGSELEVVDAVLAYKPKPSFTLGLTRV